MPPEEKTTSESDLESVLSAKINVSVHRPTNAPLKYKCTYPDCNMSFKREVGLDRHEFIHTGIKKHICHYEGCTKRFLVICHLKRHILKFHKKFKEEKTFKCTVETCDKMFGSVFMMERHVKEVHNNRKLYNCQVCAREFQRKNHLRQHEITHTGKYPFNCSKCKKGSVKEMSRHKCKIHVCAKCEKHFDKWTQLVEHMKSTHPKYIKCKYCSKEFENKTLLKKHEKVHIDDDDDTREVWQCSFTNCPRFYHSNSALKHHIKSYHDQIKYPCTFDGCTQQLTTKKSLNRHLNDIHIKKKPATMKKATDKIKPRRVRKDYGKSKRSMATFLSGVLLDPEIEKQIIQGRGDEIDIAETDLLQLLSDDEDNNKKLAAVIQLQAQESEIQ